MSDDAVVLQPEMVESESEPASAKNMSVADLIQSAQKEAKAAANTRRRSLEHLHDALTITMELYELQASDPVARDSLAERLEGHGIRSDHRTKNAFVPIAKLIFGEWENAANISRNAAALKYALDKGIKSGRLVQFFRDQGGIAKCAALEAAARRAAGTKRASKAATRLAAILSARRESATPVALPGLKIDEGKKFFSVLFELGPDGNYLPLGTSGEDDKTARRYVADDLPKRRQRN